MRQGISIIAVDGNKVPRPRLSLPVRCSMDPIQQSDPTVFACEPCLHSNDADNSVQEKEDSGVYDFGDQALVEYEQDGFSFKSFSFEFVQNWSLCSLSNSPFHSVSLQDVPSLDRRSSAWLVGINIQSMILGTSVLGFPFAFKRAGLWAIPLVFFVGLATSHSGTLLRDCLYQRSKRLPHPKRVRRSYVEVCNRAWPRHGKVIMELIVFISILRNVIVLILLTNLTVEVLRSWLVFNSRIITVVWASAVLPFLFIKRVSSLAWISFIGLSLYLSALIAVLTHCVFEYKSWSFDKLHLNFNVESVGIAAGIIINSFSQHLAFPPVEGSMKKPNKYRTTLYTAFGINVIIKILFGISAVMVYGDSICQSVTANLTNRKISIPSNICIAFFAYFTLPMQSFVVFDLLDSKFLPHFPIFRDSGNWCWLIISRSCILLPCLLIALLIPHFGLLVSFVGSIRGSLISLIFPPIFYMKIFGEKTGLIRKCQCFLIIFVGVVLGAIGVYSSSKAVVQLWL